MRARVRERLARRGTAVELRCRGRSARGCCARCRARVFAARRCRTQRRQLGDAGSAATRRRARAVPRRNTRSTADEVVARPLAGDVRLAAAELAAQQQAEEQPIVVDARAWPPADRRRRAARTRRSAAPDRADPPPTSRAAGRAPPSARRWPPPGSSRGSGTISGCATAPDTGADVTACCTGPPVLMRPGARRLRARRRGGGRRWVESSGRWSGPGRRYGTPASRSFSASRWMRPITCAVING